MTLPKREKRIVIALGSHGRGDDAVGLWVAGQLRGRLSGCTIIHGQDDSMAILNAWEDAALAVIVDAASSTSEPGTIHQLELGAQPLPREMARCSSHGVGLAEAVELGRVLGRMPLRLVIYAVEVASVEPGVDLSPAVLTAAADVCQRIESDVNAMQH